MSEKFRNEVERVVALECVDCKSWTDYPLPQFRQAHARRYLKDGYVTQYCGCGGKTSDGCGNTHHKIVGYVTEEQKRLTPGGVTRLLNKLLKGKRKNG